MVATQKQRPQISDRDIIVTLLVAAVTAFGYFFYVLAVRWLQNNPIIVEPLLSNTMLSYFTILSLIGITLRFSWRRGLRIAPGAIIVGLFIWPWLYLSIPIGSAAYVSIPFVGALIATTMEILYRSPERLRQFLTDKHALIGGSFHFILGFGLQVYTRQLWWLNPELGTTGILGGFLLYFMLGLILFSTGALPVILWKRQKLVSPALVTTVWFLWGLYGTWIMRDSLPLSDFTGKQWISLVPYPDYMLHATMLLIALLVVTGGEFLIQKMIDRSL